MTLAGEMDDWGLRGRLGLWSPPFLEGLGTVCSSGWGCGLASLSPGSRTGPHGCKGDPNQAGLFTRVPWPGEASRLAPQVGKPWAVPLCQAHGQQPVGTTQPPAGSE